MRTANSIRSLSVIADSHEDAVRILEGAVKSGELLAYCRGNEDNANSVVVWCLSHPYDPTRLTPNGTRPMVSTWVGWGRMLAEQYTNRGDRKSSRQRHLPGMVSANAHADRDGAGASQATDRLYADHGKASYRENPLRNLLVGEVKKTVKKKFGLLGVVYLRTLARGIRRDTLHGVGKEFQETLARMGIVRVGNVNITPVWVSGFRKEVATKLAEVTG